MKKRMIKIFAAFLLIMIFTVGTASAVLPLIPIVMTAAEYAAPFVVAAAIKYYMPSSATSNVAHPAIYNQSTGEIVRTAIAEKLGIAYAVSIGISQSVQTSMFGPTSGYIAMRDALYNAATTWPTSTAAAPLTVGSVSLNPYNGNAYPITQIQVLTNNVPNEWNDIIPVYRLVRDGAYSPHPTHYSVYSNVVQAGYDGGTWFASEPTYITQTTYFLGSTAVTNSPPMVAYSPAQVAVNLTDPSTGDLPPPIMADLTQAIKDHPEQMNFPDAVAISQAATNDANEKISTLLASNVAIAQAALIDVQARHNADPIAVPQAAVDAAQAALNNAIAAQAAQSANPAATIPEVKVVPLNIPGFIASDFHLSDTFATFGVRTTAFINAITASPLFTGFTAYLAFPALGNSVSVITFDAKRLGVHSFDFADLSGPFAVIRGFITLVAGMAGVKLALLGRA